MLTGNSSLTPAPAPPRRRATGLVAGLLTALVACGGGGSGGQPAADPPPATVGAEPAPAAASAPVARVQACTLLTAAEITAAIGSAPVGEGAPIAKAIPHVCRWKLTGTDRSFAVAVNPASAIPADGDHAPGGSAAVRVPGIGDRAEFTAGSAQSDLLVHVGDRVFSMACACPPNLPGQTALVALARTALSRLPAA